MTNLAIRVAINAIALWVAAELFDGITLSSSWLSVLLVAAIFGIVNAILRPIALILSLPFLILTLGLFTFVVNAAMLAITDGLTDALDVDGFWTTVFGAVVISVVSWGLSAILTDK